MGIAAHGTSEAISVVGTLRVRPEHEETFLAHAAATAETVLAKEPGAILYVIHRHPTEPHTFFFIERYEDERALQAHGEAPYVRDAVAKLQGFLVKPFDFLLLRQVIPAEAKSAGNVSS